MENPEGASYYEKMDGIARWFGMSVASAFFASLERFSCVNLSTSDSDDEYEEEEANDRPLVRSSFQSFNSATSSAFFVHQNVGANVKNAPPRAVENLTV